VRATTMEEATRKEFVWIVFVFVLSLALSSSMKMYYYLVLSWTLCAWRASRAAYARIVRHTATRSRRRGGASRGGETQRTFAVDATCPRTSLLKGRRSFTLALERLPRIGLEMTSTTEALARKLACMIAYPRIEQTTLSIAHRVRVEGGVGYAH
jgi:hypothetical protein